MVVRIDSFLGIRNQSPIRSIPDNALTAASDVDIDDVGIITQRNGYALAKAISSVTSAYSTLDQSGYVVSSGTLYRVPPDLSLIAIAASTATAFADEAKVLFTNDGLRVENNTAISINLHTPELPPVLSAITGTMPAGIYSATYCYRSASGLESGSSPIASIELLVDGGIAIAPITPPAGYTVNIYMTDANGTVFYDNNGVQLNEVQILAESFPDSIEQIAYHENRLWLSRSLPNGNTIIWFSAPYHYHLYNLQKDYIIIPGAVYAIMSSKQGLVIGTDAAIYVYGEQLDKFVDYGIVPGRAFTRNPDGTVLMATKRGACTFPPFANVTENKASFPPGLQCSTALVQQDGINKFVTLSDGSGTAYNART